MSNHDRNLRDTLPEPINEHFAVIGGPHWGRPAVIWTSIGVAVVVAVVVIVGFLVVSANPGSPHGRTSPGAARRSGGLLSSASGPSACVTKGQPAAGSGPWKLIQPKTLCHLPVDNSPQDTQAAQGLLSATELVFDPVPPQPNPGTKTSAFTVGYQMPSSANFERFINVVGFTGRFHPQAAVTELAHLDTGDFHSVPPGPHGGLMECKPVYNNEECVFGTATTLGDFTIADTLHELTGANTDVNAIRIRDALEVPVR